MPALFWLPLLLAGAAGGMVAPGSGASAVRTDAPGQAALTAPGSPQPIPPSVPVFSVAIDPGHGGSNLGAPSVLKGVMEKRVTLALARKLRDQLRGQATIKVVLCREDDSFVPIRARVRCAREAGAQLFLSLHANAVAPGKPAGSQHGFELYVLPPADIEDQAMAAALAQENDSDGAWAAHQVHGAAAASAGAARVLQLRLAEALGTAADRGVRQIGASLDVLRGVNAPAVLVEVGFLDHPGDANLLTSVEGQDKIAAALARAVVDLQSRQLRGSREQP